jgi:cytosine/adenosine deaminase-related metal-dependent hydrolase
MVTTSGGKIVAVQGYRQDRVPKTAEVVDGRDKFLIPGLWDMHVHPPDEVHLPQFIANGVTGVRVMRGSDVPPQMRERIQNRDYHRSADGHRQ